MNIKYLKALAIIKSTLLKTMIYELGLRREDVQ